MSGTPAPVVFEMGKHRAELPVDRLYCRNHMWCLPGADRSAWFGFTGYAMRLMQDVYFLDWCVNVGDVIGYKQQIGNIETSKATSDLFAPMAGTITAINGEVLKDPSLINVDHHDRGRLFEISGVVEGMMTAAEYCEFLHKTWEQTQRIIKGQMGD